MEKVDQLLHAQWVITCEDNQPVLENHSLAIKDGKIHAILATAEAKKIYQAKIEHNYSTHVFLPGLINAHTHSSMVLFRGYADDLELMDWLNNHLWPAEKKWVSADFVYDASLIAMAEMIRGGTTCFNDMYFFLQETAQAAEISGMRAHIGMTVLDFPTQWAKSADEYFAKGLDFYHRYKNHHLIQPTLAPHSAYSVSEKNLRKVKAIADEYQLRTNIHLQEAPSEMQAFMKEHKQRPLQYLAELGLVNPNLIAIHMTQNNDDDFNLVQDLKPNIVHCPESNMKLGAGACPVEKFSALGVNVALGTDGAASNNDLDMFCEMRSATFLAKLTAQNPEALPALSALKLATINGAKALGIDHLTGSLKVGKSADFIAIDFNEIETQPLYHPVSQIVYATPRHQVTDVWVAGKQLLKNKELTTLNKEELLIKIKSWQQKLRK